MCIPLRCVCARHTEARELCLAVPIGVALAPLAHIASSALVALLMAIEGPCHPNPTPLSFF